MESRSSNGKTSQEAALFFIDDAALKRYVRSSAWGGEAEPDARGRDGVLFYVSFLPSSLSFLSFSSILSFPLPSLDPMNM